MGSCTMAKHEFDKQNDRFGLWEVREQQWASRPWREFQLGKSFNLSDK